MAKVKGRSTLKQWRNSTLGTIRQNGGYWVPKDFFEDDQPRNPLRCALASLVHDETLEVIAVSNGQALLGFPPAS